MKLVEIKQERLPELDDTFASAVDSSFENLASLRERVDADLKLRAEEKTRIDFEDRVVQAVVDLAKLEFPPVLVDMEIDQLLSQQLRRWRGGEGTLEEYLASINKTEEEAREDLRPPAKTRVTRALALGEVTQREGIEVAGTEIDAEIENMTKDAGDKKVEMQKMLNTPGSRESIEQLSLTRKTLQLLVDIAKGVKVNVETEEKEEKNE